MKPFLLLLALGWGVLGIDLKSSSPERGALLEDPPLKVTLTFTSSVIPDSSSIEILHRDTTAFITLAVKATDRPEVIEALVPRKLLGGRYLVRWKTAAPNGTVTRGMYPFIVDVPE